MSVPYRWNDSWSIFFRRRRRHRFCRHRQRWLHFVPLVVVVVVVVLLPSSPLRILEAEPNLVESFLLLYLFNWFRPYRYNISSL